MSLKKIIKYGIIKYTDPTDAINEAISKGWQPFGSPYGCGYQNEVVLVQAMVKYEERSKPAAKQYVPNALDEKNDKYGNQD